MGIKEVGKKRISFKQLVQVVVVNVGVESEEKEVELFIIRRVFLLGMSTSLVGIRDQQLGIKDSNVTIPFFPFDVKI